MNFKINNSMSGVLKKIFLPVFFGSVLLLVSCGSGRSGSDSITGYSELQELVNSREFVVENQWLQPLTGSRVDLIGNTNYMRFKNDSIDLHLPYFGERHSGGGYNREGGINYEGPLKNLEILEDPANEKKIRINFEGKQGTENFWFSLILFSNGNVDTTVKSSERNSISYDGKLKPLQENLQ